MSKIIPLEIEGGTIEVPGKFEMIGKDLGKLLDKKQVYYGSSFLKTAGLLEVLFPDGIPVVDYAHIALMIRVFDKMARISSPNRSTDEENPWNDIAGYGMLGDQLWQDSASR